MKRYNITKNGELIEDVNGTVVTFKDCIENRKKYNQYETILKRIIKLEWFRIDEATGLAKWALENEV